ncbi:MAG TPA: hypothetical protein VH476_10390 [Solirubrobacterales bacterium]|jgi:hypothetical protein
MQGFRIRRPTPSMAVALVALVVALAGTGYAAVNLPKGSVGAKQLKKNSVTKAKIRKNAVTRAKVHRNAITGIKIKNRSVLGQDIRVGSLGKVPSASTADTATSLAPLEPLHLVGTAGEPEFEEGAGNVGLVAPDTLSQPVGFYKDRGGIVHLEGFAERGKDGFVFTLPPGYRPQSGITQIFETGESLILIFGSSITIGGEDVSGKVLSDGATAVLSGISFRPGS